MQAIKLVAKGDVWVDQKVIQLLVDPAVNQYTYIKDQGLSVRQEDRERKVLHGILGGLTNEKIGDDMGVPESAIKNVVQRLFTRLIRDLSG
jgi:DNA-binding NarL/FixJ family response regulator